MRNRAEYKRLQAAVNAADKDSREVELLSADEVRSMAEAEGVSVTFAENMRRSLHAKLAAVERGLIGRWIELQVRGRFPLAEVKMPEKKVAVIYLDGFEEEDE